MTRISSYFSKYDQQDTPTSLISDYLAIQDLTERKKYLDTFNYSFMRLVSHLLELSKFLTEKEKSYTD